jgi:hypothetical protein
MRREEDPASPDDIDAERAPATDSEGDGDETPEDQLAMEPDVGSTG